MPDTVLMSFVSDGGDWMVLDTRGNPRECELTKVAIVLSFKSAVTPELNCFLTADFNTLRFSYYILSNLSFLLLSSYPTSFLSC